MYINSTSTSVYAYTTSYTIYLCLLVPFVFVYRYSKDYLFCTMGSIVSTRYYYFAEIILVNC